MAGPVDVRNYRPSQSSSPVGDFTNGADRLYIILILSSRTAKPECPILAEAVE